MLAIKVKREYLFRFEGQTIFATHGDQFDQIIKHHPKAVQKLTAVLKRFDTNGFVNYFTAAAEQKIYRWQRLGDEVAKGACARAKEWNAQVAICGHTHEARQEKHFGVKYFNTGHWAGKHCSLITVSDKGIEHRYYD